MGQVLGWVLENTLVFSPRGLVSTHDASGAVLGTEVQPKPTGALLSGFVGAPTFTPTRTHTHTRAHTHTHTRNDKLRHVSGKELSALQKDKEGQR